MSTDKIPPAPTGGTDANSPKAEGILADDMTPEALTAALAKNQAVQEKGELLRAKLLGETARAPWHELQRFFAQGSLLMAAEGVDMLDVAMALAEDDSKAFEAWLAKGEAGLSIRSDIWKMFFLLRESSYWSFCSCYGLKGST